jgi:hypothetical protein
MTPYDVVTIEFVEEHVLLHLDLLGVVADAGKPHPLTRRRSDKALALLYSVEEFF